MSAINGTLRLQSDSEVSWQLHSIVLFLMCHSWLGTHGRLASGKNSLVSTKFVVDRPNLTPSTF